MEVDFTLHIGRHNFIIGYNRMFSLAHFEHELLNIVYLGAIVSNITERAEITIELRFLDDDAIADRVGGG